VLHELVDNGTLGVFLGKFLILNESFVVTEPLFLMSDEFLEHFWRLMSDFVPLCPMRMHLVLKFVQLHVKIGARDSWMLASIFVAKCQ
jgi:hypothetical protein